MKINSLERWATWCKGKWSQESPHTLSGLSLDSRQVRSGECFIAIRTEVRDGHDFLQSAFERGAAAAIVERGKALAGYPCLEVENTRIALSTLGEEARKEFRGKVIGITGSCGKTSTKEILKAILGKRTWATIGNWNNDLGLPLSLIPLNNEDYDYGVFEVGINHVGEMKSLALLLNPDYAIVTNVAAAHLEGMGSLENVAREKFALLQEVGDPAHCYYPASCLRYPEFQKMKGWAVIDESQFTHENQRERVRRYTYTLKDFSAEIFWEDSEEPFLLHSTGEGMIQNAVLALSLAQDLGIPDALIRERLSGWKPSMMRAEWQREGAWPVFVDCYNSNPLSLLEAGQIFDGVTRQYPHRLWVLGGMGELGEESGYWHKACASKLPFQSGDTILAVGKEARGFQEGIKSRETGGPEWVHIEDVKKGKEQVHSFQGPVFLKGSRRFQLEYLIPKRGEQI